MGTNFDKRQGLRNLRSESSWKWQNNNNGLFAIFKKFVHGYPICIEKCYFSYISSKLIQRKWAGMKFLLCLSLETILNFLWHLWLKIVIEQIASLLINSLCDLKQPHLLHICIERIFHKLKISVGWAPTQIRFRIVLERFCLLNLFQIF